MSDTTKESFSGPTKLLGAASKAADLKYGDRNGSWSRWIVEALTEKLALENPDLLAAIKDLAGAQADGDHTEFLAKMHAAVKKRPGLKPKLERVAREGLRPQLAHV